MEIYNIKIESTSMTFKKLFYAIKNMTKEYSRKVLLGINTINFTSKKLEKLNQEIQNSGIKVFLANNFPPCVFSFVCKYKMCDFSISIESKSNCYNMILFGGSGYPVCSYQRRSFLNFITRYQDYNVEKGETFNLKLDLSMQMYIKHIFGNKSKEIKFMKNIYNLFYFKVNDNYYVLNQNFSQIMNKDKDYILKKINSICQHSYKFPLNDQEFDAFQYMLTRKIPCILLCNSSILFSDSYYYDYLKLIFLLEF